MKHSAVAKLSSDEPLQVIFEGDEPNVLNDSRTSIMETYKEINKGLVSNNQDLKGQISLLLKEVNLLRSQVLEERSKRILCQQELKSILIDNFRKALGVIDPENNLLHLLQADDNAVLGKKAAQRTRSSNILEELRRSNLVQRRSSIARSPARRRSSSMSIATECNTSTETPTLTNGRNVDHGDSTTSDISPEESSINMSDDENHTHEDHDSENTANDNSEEMPEIEDVEVINMKNLSNISEEERDERVVEENDENVVESPVNKVTKRRRCTVTLRRVLKDTTNFVNNEESEQKTASDSDISLQTVRNMSAQQSHSQEGADDEALITGLTATLEPSRESALSLQAGELTLGQFADAVSSTPNVSIKQETTCSESSIQSRPQRSCRPKCLAEPNLNRKLRDETKALTKRKKSKRT